ncbi:MAG: 2-amino-4-hydroxy-6-hydroxymethyldihydropteridine diphosphokinase [Lachnospiraceae bacterium]|nr:2-amino-4-hydroxy-6-hydroxymethyldihydropteridine diphosphokinase [Lachnospiraceae bacterium]
MDYRMIKIRELNVYANHGVYAEETEKGQDFFINADLYLYADEQDVLSDELDETVNYAELCSFITDYMKANTCKLLERISELLCIEILTRYDRVESVRLEIRKPDAPIGLPFESVSVERKLSWHTAYLSLGSNMGEKQKFIDDAIEALKKQNHTKVAAVSDMLITKPYGPVEQDDFINCAVEIKTLLSPVKLLDFLHETEQAADRKREIHWGPRTLDMDIVFYDEEVISTTNLIVPHVDMHNRFFVLKPMSQIAGFYRHPILGKTVQQMLNELDTCEDC